MYGTISEFRDLASPFLGEGLGWAIQGYEGSFHQVAAQQFFGKDVQVIPLRHFSRCGKDCFQ